ncbi:uncharacterized protein B0H18DRAFT_1113622 [Fomitopsis serialis]|uniref:uncharacterized protein n=1 Tax=Fomitopsis serialis TaxID=139415 RepID=UPI0020084113|nr:uncharacterized protein B0H18DRAFT_1113622 [Neoantrodia serialis]KAH9936191.1 hypothetical protein B0H18DRAFT_1113622 [Neoantrodia serialis]
MTSAASTPEPSVGNDGDTSVDSTYLSHFSKHLNHVRAHLSGKDRSGRLPPSFFPPGAYWTSAEKDTFFHALTIHSRLRPDLIAEEVRTKSVVDVCLYLQLLESATRADGPVLRKDFVTAMEVSDALVTLEDQKAQPILAAEPRWESRELEEARQEELEDREKAMRARRGQAKSETNEHYREDVRHRKKEYKQWLGERKEEWKVEDTLRALDFATLEAMNRVLREEDEACLGMESEASAEPDDTEREAQTTPLDIHDNTTTTKASQADTGLVAATPPDEEMIDPILRSQPQDSQSAALNTDGASVPTSSVPDDHSRSPAVPAHTLPHHQFRPCTPPFRPASLPQSSSEPISRASSAAARPEFQSELATARRQFQKRLHMRKKRAQARGGGVISTTPRLKPGRKRAAKVLRGFGANAKPTSRTSQHASSAESTGEPDAIAEEQDVGSGRTSPEPAHKSRTRQPHVSGPRLPYKLLKKLREIGLDADKLQEEYVGVLNLKGLARLMRLYNRLHDIDSTISSQIASDVIRLLNAHVSHFMTELIHHVIVMREQERASKRNTKGWRLGKFDRISHVHVEQALTLLGCENITKKEHFDKLLTRLGLVEDDFDDAYEEPDDGGDACSDGEADDEGQVDEVEQLEEEEEEEEEVFDPLRFPLNRAIVPPVVHFPAAETLPSASGVPRSLFVSLYMPWPASSASTEPPAEEDLMSEETDADALVEELLDEEQLDEYDRILEEAYEESLWTELAGTPPPEVWQRPRRKRKRSYDDDGEDDDES